MKKHLLGLAGVFGFGLAAFAEDPSHILDQTTTTALNTAFTTLKSDLGTWMGGILPILLGIAGIFLVAWLGRLGLRMMKSMSNSGK